MKHKKSKVAIITGASKGIGRATCIELSKKGYDIALNYYSSKKEAEETIRIIKKK